MRDFHKTLGIRSEAHERAAAVGLAAARDAQKKRARRCLLKAPSSPFALVEAPHSRDITIAMLRWRRTGTFRWALISIGIRMVASKTSTSLDLKRQLPRGGNFQVGAHLHSMRR